MINLLPPEIKLERKFSRHNVVVVKYLWLTVIVAAAMSVILLTASYFARRREASIQASIDEARLQLNTLNEDYAKASELQASLGVIQGVLDNETRYSEFFAELESVVQNSVQLTSVDLQTTEPEPGQSPTDLEEQKGIVLNAQTRSNAEAVSFIRRLEDLQRVDFVDIQSLNVAEDENGNDIYTLLLIVGLNQRPGEPLEEEELTQ